MGRESQVLVKEIRRIGVVGQDSTHFGGRHDRLVGLFFPEEIKDLGLVQQV